MPRGYPSNTPITGGLGSGVWFNLATSNWDHAAAHSLRPPRWDGEENGKKVKLVGWDKDSLIWQQKKMLLLLMNMQNKLYTTQLFSHYPTIELQPVPEQWSQNLELANFTELLKKDWVHRKVQTLGKKENNWNSCKREFLLPSQPSFINWAGCLW